MEHPSLYIRENVLPKEISVKKAAEILGVGRPALSTFLNGGAALSLDLALRLQKSFKANAEDLLRMQIAHETHNATLDSGSRLPLSHVPPFLQPKAKEIEQWAESGNIPRFRLAVFIRILIATTGYGIRKFNFSGDDKAERPGWDGNLVADEPSPWIPIGSSCWELSTQKKPIQKANCDYKKRTMGNDYELRQKTTFVFVTPHEWRDKEAWTKERNAERQWKNVLVYDSNDIVQWLEHSVQGQTWFAVETDSESLGTKTLEKCWDEWSASWPAGCVPNLFEYSVKAHKQVIIERLNTESDKPIVITADSIPEALAFLDRVFCSCDDDLNAWQERTVVFTRIGCLKKIATKSSNFVAIMTDPALERELDTFRNNIPAIIIYQKHTSPVKPDIILEPLPFEAFRKGLSDSGCNDDQIEKFSKETGRSLTILRRRMSRFPSIQAPEWSGDRVIAKKLVPFLFAGMWKSKNRADKYILKRLGKFTDTEQVEEHFDDLFALRDPPVWRTATMQGLISKVDVFYPVARYISESQIERFLEISLLVLAVPRAEATKHTVDQECDQTLLNTNEISVELRENVLDMLVLLVANGEEHMPNPVIANFKTKLEAFVKDWLAGLTAKKIQLFSDDLRYLAEIAPKLFLDWVRKDIQNVKSVFRDLAKSDSLHFPSRSPLDDLITALEGLAWSTEHLPYVGLILADLASVKSNQDDKSLALSTLDKILFGSFPQTCASVEECSEALDLIIKRYPETGWNICMSNLDPYPSVVTENYKPLYRDYGQSTRKPVTKSQAYRFIEHCVKHVEAFDVNKGKVKELLSIVQECRGSTHEKIWTIIKQWCETASASDRAWLKSEITEVAFTKTAMTRAKNCNLDESHFVPAKDLYNSLVIEDIVLTNRFLFENMWVTKTLEDEKKCEFDQDHEKNVHQRRIRALEEIYEQKGFNGIIELLDSWQTGWTVGKVLPYTSIPLSESTMFASNLILTVNSNEENSLTSEVVDAFTKSVTWNPDFLYALLDRLPTAKHLNVLLKSPFDEKSWNRVRSLPLDEQRVYWESVEPLQPKLPIDQLETAVTNLIAVNRFYQALKFVEFDIEEISPRLLYQILSGIVATDGKCSENIIIDDWLFRRTLNLVKAGANLTAHEIVRLEFHFIDVIEDRHLSPFGIEDAIESDPVFYCQLIMYAYKRLDGKDENDMVSTGRDSFSEIRGSKAIKMLEILARIPGRNKDGTLNFNKMILWIEKVRRICREHSREDACEHEIGCLYANAIALNYSNWPENPILEVLEQILTDEMKKSLVSSLYIASFNRSEHVTDGQKDREQAQWHKECARTLRYSHPNVAMIHDRVAECLDRTGDFEDENAKLRLRRRT